jgi:hypothetical protein
LQIKCHPVLLTYLEIVTSLCQKKVDSENFDGQVQKEFAQVIEYSNQSIKSSLHSFPYRPAFDICLGELRKKLIEICMRSHSQNLTYLNIYVGDLLTQLLDHSSKLNTDDTDMIQYSLKYFLESTEPKMLKDILSSPKTLLNLLKVLSDILTNNKKMVNLVKYLVEILGTGFDGQSVKPGTEERLIFHKVIETAFKENKENGDVMKELIKVAPYFCAA